MNSTRICFPILLLLMMGQSSGAVAQPSVTLSAEAREDFRAVLFTFVQDDLPSMEGCHYNLFAADKAADLNSLPGKGLSIATFYKALPLVQIIAGPLPHLARIQRRDGSRIQKNATIYFRTLLSCPDERSGFGQLISISMRRFERGRLKRVDTLTRNMKFHMQYYDPSTAARRETAYP